MRIVSLSIIFCFFPNSVDSIKNFINIPKIFLRSYQVKRLEIYGCPSSQGTSKRVHTLPKHYTGPEKTSQNYPHLVPLTNVPAIDSKVFLRPLGRRQIVLREEINLTSPTGPLDACINLFGRKKCGSSVKAMLEIGEDGRSGVTLATRPYWLCKLILVIKVAGKCPRIFSVRCFVCR